MTDSKTEELQPKVDEKEEKLDEETGNAGFGGFGVASSWLNQGSSWGASFLNSAKAKVSSSDLQLITTHFRL